MKLFLSICLSILGFALVFPANAQVLSIAITESTSGEYDDDVNAAIAAGAQATSLTLFWDEGDASGYYDHDPDWPQIANAYYPSKNIGLILSIPVIDTVADRRPEDLLGLEIDDPEVLARFETYINQVLDRLTDTKIFAISIGNEVDGVLNSQNDWDEFGRFFRAARAIVRQRLPDTKIGFTVTWQGVSGRNATRIADLNSLADAFFVNYYPLNNQFRVLPPANIASQLDNMIKFAAGKQVMLIETGYPSEGCGSSPAKQLEYFQELFSALQDRRHQIPLVNLVWLHDIPAAELAGYRGYYDVSSPCFESYLGTLGLRNLDGTSKPSYDWLTSR